MAYSKAKLKSNGVHTKGINLCSFIYTVYSDCPILLGCMCSAADAISRGRSHGTVEWR